MYNSVWPSQPPKKAGLHTEACVFPPSFSSTTWTIPWTLSTSTSHLYTLNFLGLSVTSDHQYQGLLACFYSFIILFIFPFSVCRCYSCCILSLTDLLPCIPLAIPALYPKSQLIHTKWSLLCVTQQSISNGNPPAWLNFSNINAIVPPFSSAHFLDVLLQLSTVKSQTHSHNHLLVTFGSLLRPSCLLQPPLQLSQRI